MQPEAKVIVAREFDQQHGVGPRLVQIPGPERQRHDRLRQAIAKAQDVVLEPDRHRVGRLDDCLVGKAGQPKEVRRTGARRYSLLVDQRLVQQRARVRLDRSQGDVNMRSGPGKIAIAPLRQPDNPVAHRHLHRIGQARRQVCEPERKVEALWVARLGQARSEQPPQAGQLAGEVALLFGELQRL